MENVSKIQEFKEVMRQGMIQNFKEYGGLSPILFFLKDNQPHIIQLPTELFSSSEGKHKLLQVIKQICIEPNVLAAGMIIEAYGVAMRDEDKFAQEILSGNKRVSEHDNRKDIIVMIFSTPEFEELYSYEVNEDTKEVYGEFGKHEKDNSNTSNLSGLFSGFFNWNKN